MAEGDLLRGLCATAPPLGGKCEVCQRDVYLMPRNFDRRQVFCSKACEQSHYSRAQREKRIAAPQKQWEGCGKEFQGARSGQQIFFGCV